MGSEQTEDIQYNSIPIKMELIPESIRELPPPADRRPAKRTILQDIETIKSRLTEEQGMMFDALWAFIKDDSRWYHLLSGHAGSGKTTLITAFIESFLQQRSGWVGVTATTHKAVVVLADKMEISNGRLIYGTVHSQFHLRPQVDEHGNLFFDVPKGFPSKYKLDFRIKLLIIDESSMIDQKLHKIIIERAAEAHVKVIFVGDFYQIPPPGEQIALIGTADVQQQLGMQVSMLHKVVRQAAGNPIIQLATYTREHEHLQRMLYDYKTEVTEQGSILLLDRNNIRMVLEVIKHLMANRYFRDNPDYTKVLAWRKKTVNKMNSIIRIMIYGRQARVHALLPGEKLIAGNPIIDVLTGSVIFANNAEFEVVRYTIDWKDIEGQDYKYFRTSVKQRLINPVTLESTDIVEEISIIHPDSKAAFQESVDDLYRTAMEYKNTPQAAYRWRMYYQMMEQFADVRYNYCLTSHKAQGSTFRNAVILERDISSNSNISERNRILYVAYTRPSINLLLVR